MCSSDLVAAEYPHYSTQITTIAKESFLHGDQWAYTAGIVAVLLGAVLVFVFFPRAEREKELLAGYQSQDAAPAHEEPPDQQQAPAPA